MANRFRGVVLATLIGVTAACVLAPGAALAGTLDQQQTDTGGASGGITSGTSYAQTFTAGLSGGVDQVDLDLASFLGAPTADLSVDIRSVDPMGFPGGTVLATQNVPAASIPASPAPFAFVPVHFAAPAPVAAGTQYAIVAYSANSNTYGWALSHTPGPYTGGAAYDETSSSGPWSLFLSGGYDLAFKTYVVPPTSAATQTGQRAAALKKCKKKHSHKKRKKCKKRANLLPL